MRILQRSTFFTHLFLLLVAFLFRVSEAAYGVDVSSATYINAFTCMKSNGYSFAIIRCYQSTGNVDPNGPHTVYNAWDGGMSAVDVYMFPCPTCGKSAATQVTEAVNYLRSFNAKYGTFWLDIEGPQYWSSQGNNRQFFTELVSQAQSMGQTVGVYTSASQWGPIMGNWNGGASLPLWYAHYDNNPSFSDFSPFGGWNRPAMKQYNGDVTVCGAGVDQNWYP